MRSRAAWQEWDQGGSREGTKAGQEQREKYLNLLLLSFSGVLLLLIVQTQVEVRWQEGLVMWPNLPSLLGYSVGPRVWVRGG